MADTLKQQAFSSMQWTAASSTYTAVLQLIQITVLAYFLSPEEIGTMTMIMLVIWFTQAFSDGGMSPAIVHYRFVEAKVLNTIYLLNIGLGLLLYLLLNLLAVPLSVLFSQPDLPAYLPLALTGVLLHAIATQFRVFMIKELRFNLIARQEMITSTIYFVLAVYLAWMGHGVWAMVIGFIAGSLCGTVWICWHGSKLWRPGLQCTRTGLGKFLSFGKFQMGDRVLVFFNTRLDQILVGSLIGPQALGIYTIAHSFVINPVVRINQIITNVMFPVFARLQEEAPLLRQGFLKVMKTVTLINTPVLLGLMLVAPLFIPMVFDLRWHEAITVLQILSVYSLIRSTGSPGGSLQLAMGRADLGFKWNLLLLVVSLPVIFTGARLGELTGVAWSLLLMQSVLLTVYAFMVIRPLAGPPLRDYFLSIYHGTRPGVLMALSVWGIGHLSLFTSPLAGMILMILSGVFLFLFFSYLLERKLFMEIKELLLRSYSPVFRFFPESHD